MSAHPCAYEPASAARSSNIRTGSELSKDSAIAVVSSLTMVRMRQRSADGVYGRPRGTARYSVCRSRSTIARFTAAIVRVTATASVCQFTTHTRIARRPRHVTGPNIASPLRLIAVMT